MREVIVGSGPAALACAAARIAAGAQVHVLDIGAHLEPERDEQRMALAALPPDKWPVAVTQAMRSGFHVDAASTSLRPHFGSLFAYDRGQLALDQHKGTHVIAARARGGLLAVWGANMVAPRWQDLQAIHPDSSAWREAVQAIAQLVHLSGEIDDLASEYPLFAQGPLPPLSQQGQYLLAHWQANGPSLAASTIRFGRSRLAVRAADCQLCGSCLTGCPYLLPFDGVAQWQAWQASGQVTMQGGFTATAIAKQTGGGWLIHSAEPANAPVAADRVFVATGVVSTLRIAAQSWLATANTAQLRYHPYLLAPSLMAAAAPAVESERLHTMPQLLLQLQNDAVAAEPVHVQVSTYNHWMGQELVRRLPQLAHVKTLREQLAGRLLGIQVYLHSGTAPPIGITIQRSQGQVRLSFAVDGSAKLAAVRSQQKAVLAALTRSTPALGMAPIPGMVQWGRPGDGNHVGASMPMRASPQPGETDLLGQPPGWEGVHVVDASVLAEIPSYTMTYLAMANAWRIAKSVVG